MEKILIFAPHPDDEILGAGGMMAHHIARGDEVYVCIVTKGTEPLFPEAGTVAIRKAARECHAFLGVKETFFLDFPAVMLEKENRYELNGKVSNLVNEIKPDEVYIPHYGDMQMDHRLVAEAAMVAVRPKNGLTVKKVYAYETLSETGWNAPNVQNEFIPNVFLNISDYLDKKIEALHYYSDQIAPFPEARSYEAIEALAKYRGAVMNKNAVEAFMLIREIID